MRGRIAALALGMAAWGAAGGAVAMSPAQGQCRVVDADKLPAEAGGAEALCAAVEHAIAIRAPGVVYDVEVRVASPSSLAASGTANGRKVEALRFAVSDGKLNPRSIERFAQAVGAAIAKAKS